MFLLIIILFTMTVLGSFAGFFLKRAAGGKMLEMLKGYNLYVGAFLYLMAALLNVYVLSKLDYSFVLPFTSITYVWTMVLAGFLLKEKVGIKKNIGVGLIVAGALVIAIL